LPCLIPEGVGGVPTPFSRYVYDCLSSLRCVELRAHYLNDVLLDVIMPKMGGWECFNHLKQINSDVRVLIITGYTADGSSQDFLKEGAIGIIEKPFNLDEFTETVSKIIKCEY